MVQNVVSLGSTGRIAPTDTFKTVYADFVIVDAVNAANSVDQGAITIAELPETLCRIFFLQSLKESFAGNGKIGAALTMFVDELADKVILVKEVMSGLFHSGRFEQAVTIPKDSGVNDERKESAKSIRLSKFLLQVRIALSTDEGLNEVDIHQTAQKTNCAAYDDVATTIRLDDNVVFLALKIKEKDTDMHLTLNPFQTRILAKYLTIALSQIDFKSLSEEKHFGDLSVQIEQENLQEEYAMAAPF